MEPSGRLLLRASAAASGLAWGGELLRDDLQAGRDRTAHATLLSTILDVLAGSSRAAEAPPPLLDPLSDAERPQRASGNELQPRALHPQCGRQRGGDAVVVRGEERID